LLTLALLQEGLGDEDLVVSWDGSVFGLVLSPAYNKVWRRAPSVELQL
jgi:hypothetical protein